MREVIINTRAANDQLRRENEELRKQNSQLRRLARHDCPVCRRFGGCSVRDELTRVALAEPIP